MSQYNIVKLNKSHFSKCLISFVLLMSCFSVSAVASSFTVDDALSFTRIGEVSPGSNGQVAFVAMNVLSTAEGKKWQASLYLKDKQGKLSLVATPGQSISLIAWSPDEKSIAYLAPGKNYQSIWVYNLQTKENEKLFEFKSDISSFKWSPDGDSIAFVANDAATKNTGSALTPIDKENDYTNDRLYLIHVADKTITPISLTPSTYSISQFTSPQYDGGFDWSPDGKSIAFLYQHSPSATYIIEAKIAILDLKTGKITDIPATKKYSGHQVFYSPDGKWLAFSASSRDENSLDSNPYAFNNTCIMNTKSLKTTCLANTFNEAPTILGWDQKSDHLFVMDSYKTSGVNFYAVNINPHQAVKLMLHSKDGYIDPLSLSLSADHETLGFSYQTTTIAPQAYISPVDAPLLEKISDFTLPFNQSWGQTSKITWKSPDGMPMEGLLLTPPDYNPNKKYPLVVEVHGGPIGAWTNRYLGGCEEYGEYIVPFCFENILSQGFVILQPNPRGSNGYGKAFRFANIGELGGKDYQDIISGVDYLESKNIADPQHLAIFGWSYGGYMTAWAISQSNRFKVAIDGDGLTDFVSFVGTTDIPWYLSQYLGQPLWDNDKLYIQRSPIFYTKNIKTPLLMLEGAVDQRVPPTQADELYNALTKQHKTVQLVISPAQGHVPNDANIIYGYLQLVNHWLVKDL